MASTELVTYNKILQSPFLLLENGELLLDAQGSPILGEPSEDFALWQASMGTPRQGEGKVHGCVICGEPFRESDLLRFRGNWYCKPNLHTGVIRSILRKEAADAYVPDSSGESPAAVPIVASTETPDA